MSAIDNIKTTYDKVKACLERYPDLRDNHSKLTANFWAWEIKKMKKDVTQLSAYQLLHMIAGGELTSEETIGRARRKVQEEHAELRGERYQERMKEEKDVREKINH